MRAFILVAGALALGACNAQETATNQAATPADLTAEDVAGNDLTAIDAVAAEDSNLAADVNFDANESDNASGNGVQRNSAD